MEPSEEGLLTGLESVSPEASFSSSLPGPQSSPTLWSKVTLIAAITQQLQEQHPFLVSGFFALRILAAFALVLCSIGLAWFLAWKSVLRHVGFIRDIVHGILGIKKPGKKRQVYARRSGVGKAIGEVKGVQVSDTLGRESLKGSGPGSSRDEVDRGRGIQNSEGKQPLEAAAEQAETKRSLIGDRFADSVRKRGIGISI
jgi:hypothetical protein